MELTQMPFAKFEPQNHMDNFPSAMPHNENVKSPNMVNGGAKASTDEENAQYSHGTNGGTSDESNDDAEKSSFNCGESKLEIVESPVGRMEASHEQQQPSPVQARVSFTMLHDKAVSD